MNHPLHQAREELLAFALGLPGTREDTPWGERVAKVNGKIFVFFGKSRAAEPRLQFAVKLVQSGLAALDLPGIEPTGYGMGKHGWVTVTFAEGERPDLARARAWVLESYRAIAPKQLVAQLAGPPGGDAPAAKRASKPARKSQAAASAQTAVRAKSATRAKSARPAKSRAKPSAPKPKPARRASR